jgi:hypothetical protein
MPICPSFRRASAACLAWSWIMLACVRADDFPKMSVSAEPPRLPATAEPSSTSADPYDLASLGQLGTVPAAASDVISPATVPSSTGAAPLPDPLDQPKLIATAEDTVPPNSVASPQSGRLAVPTDTGSPAPAATANDSNRPPAPSTAVNPPVAALTSNASPTANVTINLIHLMVKRGLITQTDADGLVHQAQQEAAAAQQQTAANAVLPEANPPDDTVAVAYVPDVVKNQIREEVTADVLQQQRADELASQKLIPSTAPQFHVAGDFRMRYEDDMYPSGNAVGLFPNFNAINTGAGFDINSLSPALPEYNVNADRNRFRIRARFGTDVDLHDGFSVGLRIGTGQDDTPTTENQTLDAANNGQGGNFAKYAIWLDRAFLRYELGANPDKDLSVTIGRFEDPFFHTSMLFADDLGFDGAVVQARYKVANGFTPFFTAGGFPVFNTDLNFSSDQSEKFTSEDKYLFAVQTGAVWKINQDFSAKGAVAYYYYQNVEGKVSDPMLASSNEAGNTDDSRPSFAQNGNTYIALRDYEDPSPGTTPELQYYGLATPFHVLALTGQLDFSRFDPFHISLVGELIKNVAFNRQDIINNGPASDPGPQNNTDGSSPDSFSGGDTGGIIRLNLGSVALAKFGDWNVNASYRRVETDATIDAFTDADFGGDLVGTNLQGYTLGGNFALSPYVWTGLRYMSADSVSGAPYKNDLVQFDINAQF